MSANTRYGQGLSFEILTSGAARFSDHSPFWDNGYPAFLTIENFFDGARPRDRNPWYHTTGDLLSRVNLNYVARSARTALAVVAESAGIVTPGTPTNTPTTGPTPTTRPTNTPTATSTATATPAGQTCSERVANGGFEANASWTFPGTATTAGYTTAQAHGGARSARFGLLAGAQAPAVQRDEPERNLLGEVAPLAASYSSGYQTISVPAGVDSATLHFWYRPGTQAASGDFQRVLLLEPGSYGVIRTVMRVLENSTTWREASFDLTPYRGRSLVVYFEVYNDSLGSTGRTWMFLDDVSVQACTG
jgi:hypothetical protein